MSNHPNRSKSSQSRSRNPEPQEVALARSKAQQSIEQAAGFVHVSASQWEGFEKPTTDLERRRMHPGLFELYLIKTGQKAVELTSSGLASDLPVRVNWKAPQGEVEWWPSFFTETVHAVRGDGRLTSDTGEKWEVVRAVCGASLPDDFRQTSDKVTAQCPACEDAMQREAEFLAL